MIKRELFISMGLIFLLLLPMMSFGETSFPGRDEEKFKKVQYIEIDDLYKEYKNNTATLVDVRSKLEFDTIHPKGALHLSIAKPGFEDKLKGLVSELPGKKIAFY